MMKIYKLSDHYQHYLGIFWNISPYHEILGHISLNTFDKMTKKEYNKTRQKKHFYHLLHNDEKNFTQHESYSDILRICSYSICKYHQLQRCAIFQWGKRMRKYQ